MSQSIAGTNLATNAAARSRIPCVELRIAWGRSSWPTDWTAQSTNETARLLDLSLQRQLSVDPLHMGSARPTALSLTLDNRDQKYSAFNTGSSITASILGSTTTAGGTTVTYPKLHGSPVRLRLGYTDATNGNEFITVFSGYVDNPQADAYGLSGDRLALTCLDRGVELVDQRASTFMHNSLRANDWINIVLAQAGLSSNLDNGIFTIPYLWMDDETLWQEILDAAQADGGWFFVDELGVATFKAATWWATDADSTTVQATITVANIQDIANSVDWSTLATGVIFEYTPRTPGGEQDLYRSQDVLVIPPGTKDIDVRFSYPADNVQYFGGLPAPVFTAVTSGGRRLDTVSLSFLNTTAQRTALHFENTGSETAFIPPFTMRGPAIMGNEARTVKYTMTSLAPYPKDPRVSGGPYVQTEAQAEMLKVLYGDRLRYPRMTYNVGGFKAMPWLQLGDRVRINVSAPYTSTRDMIVTGITLAWQPGAPLLQTLTGVDVLGLYEYDDYFIIGTSVYGDTPLEDAGRVWL